MPIFGSKDSYKRYDSHDVITRHPTYNTADAVSEAEIKTLSTRRLIVSGEKSIFSRGKNMLFQRNQHRSHSSLSDNENIIDPDAMIDTELQLKLMFSSVIFEKSSNIIPERRIDKRTMKKSTYTVLTSNYMLYARGSTIKRQPESHAVQKGAGVTSGYAGSGASSSAASTNPNYLHINSWILMENNGGGNSLYIALSHQLQQLNDPVIQAQNNQTLPNYIKSIIQIRGASSSQESEVMNASKEFRCAIAVARFNRNTRTIEDWVYHYYDGNDNVDPYQITTDIRIIPQSYNLIRLASVDNKFLSVVDYPQSQSVQAARPTFQVI